MNDYLKWHEGSTIVLAPVDRGAVPGLWWNSHADPPEGDTVSVCWCGSYFVFVSWADVHAGRTAYCWRTPRCCRLSGDKPAVFATLDDGCQWRTAILPNRIRAAA